MHFFLTRQRKTLILAFALEEAKTRPKDLSRNFYDIFCILIG